MHEETGLKVSGLKFHGLLNYYMGKKKELDQTVFVFSAKRFSGRIRNSREGETRWFVVDEIPYGEMWEDQPIWVPLLIAGRRFVGDFQLIKRSRKLVRHNIKLIL